MSNAVLFAHEEGILNSEECVYFYRILKKQEGLLCRRKIQLESMPDYHARKNYRFTKYQIFNLNAALNLPETFVADNRSRIDGIDGLCLLLRRLVYPQRLHDLEQIFGREQSVLSRLFNVVLNFIYENLSNKLTSLNQDWITQPVVRR